MKTRRIHIDETLSASSAVFKANGGVNLKFSAFEIDQNTTHLPRSLIQVSESIQVKLEQKFDTRIESETLTTTYRGKDLRSTKLEGKTATGVSPHSSDAPTWSCVLKLTMATGWPERWRKERNRSGGSTGS